MQRPEGASHSLMLRSFPPLTNSVLQLESAPAGADRASIASTVSVWPTKETVQPRVAVSNSRTWRGVHKRGRQALANRVQISVTESFG